MNGRRMFLLALLAGAAGCFTPMSRTGTPAPAPGPVEPGRAIHLSTLLHLDPGAVMYLDVRSPIEFARGHVPGALNVPVTEVAARVEEIRLLAAGRPIVVYCNTGGRADAAIAALAEAGIRNTRHLAGDFRAWRAAGLPVEHEPPPPVNDWQRWY